MNPSFTPPGNDFRSFFRNRTSLTWLILINIGVWLAIQAGRVLLFLMNRGPEGADPTWVLNGLALPASLPTLWARPWTMITYMFLHISVWHILFNMIWLYWFGKIFLEYMSQRKLTLVYLAGGIAGGLVYVAAYNLFPVFHEALPNALALGASASVMAVVTAISFYIPNYSIYMLFLGRVKISYLAVALFVFDFFMIPSGNAGGHFAHIGGAIFGFAYARLSLPNRKPFGTGLRRFFERVSRSFPSKGPHGTNYANDYGRPVSDEEYNRKKAEKNKRIDQILEKISQGGYDSLTREEKEFLFRSSNKS